MSGSQGYKYCIVPMCTSTTYKTPDKVFFSVPRNNEDRKMWCRAMKRDEKKNAKLSSTSVRHVCEDHFDLPNDMNNFMRYKLQGGNLFLKKGVLPHIFDCQRSPIPSRQTGQKRKRAEIITDLMASHSSSSHVHDNNPLDAADVPIDDDHPLCTADAAIVVSEVNFPPQKEVAVKSVQVTLKLSVRSKAVNTVKIAINNATTSPIKSLSASVSCGSSPKQYRVAEVFSSVSGDSYNDNLRSSDESFIGSSESDIDMSDPEILKLSMRNNFVSSIKLNPRIYLGIPKESLFLISFLAEKTNCRELDIMIMLKKIRLDESCAMLGLHFGMSAGNISRIFSETTIYVSTVLKELILWPDIKQVRSNLPISFRTRYSKVFSIIDCFEIQIEKPTNSIHQALTWSEYKKCNTIKYLVSCTPDGLTNFVSVGYGGRATDTAIVEDSGYLDKLLPGMHIMADRGFKHISSSLEWMPLSTATECFRKHSEHSC